MPKSKIRTFVFFAVAGLLLAISSVNLWMWSLMNTSNAWQLTLQTNLYHEHAIEMVMFAVSIMLSLTALYFLYRDIYYQKAI